MVAQQKMNGGSKKEEKIGFQKPTGDDVGGEGKAARDSKNRKTFLDWVFLFFPSLDYTKCVVVYR